MTLAVLVVLLCGIQLRVWCITYTLPATMAPGEHSHLMFMSVSACFCLYELTLFVAEAEPYDTCQDAYTITSLPFVYSGTEANMPTSYSACGATDRHSINPSHTCV